MTMSAILKDEIKSTVKWVSAIQIDNNDFQAKCKARIKEMYRKRAVLHLDSDNPLLADWECLHYATHCECLISKLNGLANELSQDSQRLLDTATQIVQEGTQELADIQISNMMARLDARVHQWWEDKGAAERSLETLEQQFTSSMEEIEKAAERRAWRAKPWWQRALQWVLGVKTV